ncbi:Hsp70 family protein [Rhodococcus sp. NPDC127528]|uniref:Hsp70 family protein n=1 Tax=unclassified Rhodococcus (in: high G+C Gram-positive bacteria) TaxID=192944 RepID=UPI00362885A2
MAAALGLVVGSLNSTVVRLDPATSLADSPALTRRSTLRLSELADGTDEVALGPEPGADGVLAGFVGKVGDVAGVPRPDGTAYRAEDLVAIAMSALVTLAREESADLPDEPGIVATHPARWDDPTVDAMGDALDHVGLGGVTLVSDPVAAVAWLEAAQGPLGEGVVAVFDLGAAGLDVSLVRTATPASYGLLRPSTYSSLFGGDSFDRTVVEHVLGAVAADLGPIDLADPATRAELAELRDRCRVAKEQLGTAEPATVAVTLAGVDTTVPLTRAELEEMLRGPIEGSLSLVGETIRAHELDPAEVRTVLLTGGGAAMPLVSELAASTLGIATVAAPAHAAALGAAVLASGGAAGGPPAAVGAALASAATTPIAAAAVPSGDATVSPSGEADTDSLPVLPAPAPPTAFGEAGPGQPVSQVLPGVEPQAAADPARRRTLLIAAGVAGALLLGAIAAAAVLLRDDTVGTPVPHILPAVTTTPAAITTTTTPAPATTTTAAIPVPTIEVTTPARITVAPSTTEALPPVVVPPVVEPPLPTVTTPAATTTTTTTTTTSTATTTTTTTTTTEPPAP